MQFSCLMLCMKFQTYTLFFSFILALMNYVCCHFMSERKYIHGLKWSMPAKFSLGISDRLEELWDATLWFSVFRTRGWLAWRTLSLCFEMGFTRVLMLFLCRYDWPIKPQNLCSYKIKPIKFLFRVARLLLDS